MEFLKNEEYCFDKGVRHIKDNLLKNLMIQDQIKQLYVNKVKETEEIKKKSMNILIEKSIQEKLNREVMHEEANNLRKHQLYQNHFKLLNDQIKDKKKIVSEEKKILKQNLEKNIGELNEFNNEMWKKEDDIKKFYKNSLNNQITENKRLKINQKINL